ncbi:MAG: A/G-specific adenine glycosylase [Pseudomonadota bacterium]
MLQQTQVATVIPYYQRFLQRFPTLHDLAIAPSGDVMAHWAGLGYYTRARNLHRCAQVVVEQHDGQFPADPALLAELPGIGRSTAAAIAAFAWGTRAAIMDGNVKRVFARVFGVTEYPGLKPVEERLWHQAEALLPADEGIESYTQGLMDLGATICTRSQPTCLLCPLQARCVALKQNLVAQLPVRKPKKAIPQKYCSMLVALHQGQVLLLQRPSPGIWAGLLSLPELDGHQAEATPFSLDHAAQVLLPFGSVVNSAPLPTVSHGFTHFKLEIQPYLIQMGQRQSFAGQIECQWLNLADIEGAALPAPVKKLLLGIASEKAN